MTLPHLTRNGSSPARLAEGYEVARLAIGQALKCVQDTAPNARDYLTADDYITARTEHEARVRVLRIMGDEMAALARHCGRATRKEREHG